MSIAQRLRHRIARAATWRLPGERTRRIIYVAAVLVMSTLLYGLVLSGFDVSEQPEEHELGAAASGAAVALYVEPLAIDPINESMQVRISVVPTRSADGASVVVPERDLVLMIHHDSNVEHVRIQAGHPPPQATFGVDLHDG